MCTDARDSLSLGSVTGADLLASPLPRSSQPAANVARACADAPLPLRDRLRSVEREKTACRAPCRRGDGRTQRAVLDTPHGRPQRAKR